MKLGYTKKSLDEFLAILEKLYFDSVWNGSNYDLLSRNCCHFSTVLAHELGVGESIPPWINLLANSLGGADPEVLFVISLLLGTASASRSLLCWQI